ncbi:MULTISPECIES: phage baseplate assembly protein V [unclassified Novosphingobium]|uniref:phage baseplate assembly protein V n=1 Tax=unclassified Novosphingobium TaxID=2644732 RepID=UPI00135CDCD5|nr:MULTISPECIES: phage baseplate assembly protein V [unclassified Novosphingobium]
MARTADPEQLTGEVIQLGTVAAVDYGAATCTVTIGDLVTGELPWFAWSAGGVRIWAAPTPGEQGAVLCPEGDLDNGLFLPGIYSDAFAPPSNDPNVVHIQMPDGAFIAYNHASHALTVTLPSGGTVTLDAPGGATINGDVTINGNVTIAGKAEASEDVVGGGISLKGHKHSAVAAGTAQSGGPV